MTAKVNMQSLYFARFLCACWTLSGFVGFFICWGIELREDIDMSSFRSTEAILIIICLGIVWLLLHTIIRKYDKGEPPVKKTKKEKLRDMCLIYFLILTFIVPILCYCLSISGWEFMVVEFVTFIMLWIMGKLYDLRELGYEDEDENEEEFY